MHSHGTSRNPSLLCDPDTVDVRGCVEEALATIGRWNSGREAITISVFAQWSGSAGLVSVQRNFTGGGIRAF